MFHAGTNNTDEIRNNQFLTPAYAAAITVNPYTSFTLVQPGLLTGALTVNLGVGSASTAPYVGDVVECLFISDATGRTVTLGTGILATAATIVIPASKTANVSFMFNGASWCEQSRAITI